MIKYETVLVVIGLLNLLGIALVTLEDDSSDVTVNMNAYMNKSLKATSL